MEVTDAQVAVARAGQNLANAQFDYLTALVRLESATGIPIAPLAGGQAAPVTPADPQSPANPAAPTAPAAPATPAPEGAVPDGGAPADTPNPVPAAPTGPQ